MKRVVVPSSLIIGVLFSCLLGSAQKPKPPSSPPVGEPARTLEISTRTVSPHASARNIVGLPKCDSDGNIYIASDPDANSGIGKFNSKAEQVALFRASAATDLKVDLAWSFSVSPEDLVYEIVYIQDAADRFVIVFDKDGTYKSKIKLDPGFEFLPTQVSVFPTGEMIVTGLRFDPDRHNKTKWPFTGIFSSTGALLKELSLADDRHLHDMAARDDPHVVATPGANTNSAVERGALEIGSDGNAYLMRRLSPAIFYVISPGGSVARRFTVSAGDGKESFMPISMHVSRQRIAILFHDSQTKDQIIKVVDLEGREMATYRDDAGGSLPKLGVSFACFSDAPERYVFLGQSDDNRLEFRLADPK